MMSRHEVGLSGVLTFNSSVCFIFVKAYVIWCFFRHSCSSEMSQLAASVTWA